MNSRILRKAALAMALGACLGTMAPMAMAQSATGAVAGRAEAGARVTITNPATGFTRTVTAGEDGSYRLPLLPPGTYTVQAEGGQQATVTVTLGATASVNLAAEPATLQSIEVVGTRFVTPVDVTSTESAMNINAEELARLPVDRNVTSVALLAPGVASGSASFGGISFGGSSVAENAFYVNGLNVTDFYNRVGFSEAPFDFYEDFQVKTGGYSVEFGRTTGGVVNAVARSGTNEFHYGSKLVWGPKDWESSARDSYLDGERYLTRSKDKTDSTRLNVWASGPIVKDRLFFFAMYEGRKVEPENTNDAGTSFNRGDSDDGFWGTTLDWQVTDRNLLSLMAFSNENRTDTTTYAYDFDSGKVGQKLSDSYSETGGTNWALTWSSYLTDNLSMKVMHGRNERNSVTGSPNDVDCNYVTRASGVPDPGVPLGCTNNATVYDRNDERKQSRIDFEWGLGDHLLRFGIDDERNTSDLDQVYSGPGGVQYNVYTATPLTNNSNCGGFLVPAGYTACVRARQYAIFGEFESTNRAYYVEDNWSITDNLVLNLGLRYEEFDNKDAEGRTYIKMDDMWAPRLGFSWDPVGQGTMKVFGNIGRYFLPVANVINIKQGGALLDARTYYGLDGWEIRERDGVQYAVPVLGQYMGFDDDQGDGTVGDLRAEVDADMDPVYQDELILGFQQVLGEKWSWGARGIYRKLHNAIDDINITATHCGRVPSVWVMGNPGKDVTIWGDTDCDGSNDGYITVDTSKGGYWTESDDYEYIDGEWEYVGSTPTGQRGWSKPKRTYKALELQLDRAWDGKWAFNASYTLSWSEGNAEGPVNTDTNFGDTGRTENFDDPFVNYRGHGPLANDHRHQVKLRGTYALTENWSLGATVDARSGGPITGFGVGNPYNWKLYHSYFVCVDKCTPEEAFANPQEGDTWSTSDRVYEHSARGGAGRMPWYIDVGLSVGYERQFGPARFSAKLSAYNIFNRQHPVWVYQDLESSIGTRDEFFGRERFLQSPRYGQLVLALEY
ncbi:TonB-dependent receptor [Pseudoxanthomonas sp. SGD-10]|nr:TonB-dependent receptor [Pseudoxanthomonas sp. SGD-10]